MLISVIVPIYNMEAYLAQCLDSLLAQRFTDFELLLVDDGSRDASPAICDRYADRDNRIRVIRKPNGGVSSARNAGIEAARGHYLLFVDPDDWVGEEFLSQFLEGGMDDRTLPVTGLIQHRPKAGDRLLTAPARDEGPAGRDEALRLLRRCDMLGFVPNKLYVREIVMRHGIRFIEGLAHREDELFALDYLPFVKRVRINERAAYHYRVLESGYSRRRKPCGLQLDVARRLHARYGELFTSPEDRYITARTYLRQTCAALAAAATPEELRAAAGCVRDARREYLAAFDRRFLTDPRDRKVAARQRLVFALGSGSARLLRALVQRIHI